MWRPVVPSINVLLWLTPALVVVIVGAGALAGVLRARRRWRVGDTRKLFHFVIFTAAVGLSVTLGLAAVNWLGGLTVLFVLYAVRRGEGNPLFEALARPGDAPQRGRYVLVPLVATAAGGILASVLFGFDAARVAFVVAGWGDAVAEPVGIRFGRHSYRVPNFGGGMRSRRSIEGSAAVLVASAVGVLVVGMLQGLPCDAQLIGAAATIGAVAVVVEAVSPHGLDNLTLQVAAAGAAWGLGWG